MVQIVNVKAKKGLGAIWNISANVGRGSPNKQADIDLVQMCYKAALTAAPALNQPQFAALKAAIEAIKPGAACNGRDDDPLVKTILLHEAARGSAKDGRVSVIKTSDGIADLGFQYILSTLNADLCKANQSEYPRLDKISGCPPTLRGAVLDTFAPIAL